MCCNCGRRLKCEKTIMRCWNEPKSQQDPDRPHVHVRSASCQDICLLSKYAPAYTTASSSKKIGCPGLGAYISGSSQEGVKRVNCSRVQ